MTAGTTFYSYNDIITNEQYITKDNIQYQWLTECSIHQTGLSVYKSEKYTNAIKSLPLLVQINVKRHIHTAYTHFNRNMQIVTH